MLSPMIFLIVIDWIMKKTILENNTGIQWTFAKKLEDLDFADGIALLSHRQQDAQSKLNRLSEEARKVGLNINKRKTEVVRINNEQDRPIQLEEEEIIDTDKFVYLGSVVNRDGGTDEDIKSRINKARLAFNTLRPIWNSSALSLKSKVRIFNTNVKAVLLYGSVENNQGKHKQASDVRKQMPKTLVENSMARDTIMRQPMGKDEAKTHRQQHQKPYVEVDRTHLEKTRRQCGKTST